MSGTPANRKEGDEAILQSREEGNAKQGVLTEGNETAAANSNGLTETISR